VEGAELVLVGGGRRLAAVEKALGDLRVRLRNEVWDPGLLSRLGPETLALLLVETPRKVSPPLAVKALTESRPAASLPVFVLVSDRPGDQEVRKLYRAGATAVFRWPREALMLPRLLVETLGIALVQGKTREADRSLSRRIRAQLRMVPSLQRGLRVRCRDGSVQIEGRTESLRRKRELEEIVGHVPGVRAVSASGLLVEPSNVPDRQLARTIRTVIESASGVDARTLTASVDRGYVTLAGTVAARSEMTAAVELIERIRGVRGVRNLVTVASARRGQDRSLALRLERLLLLRFPSETIRVHVFGGVAVLEGTVARLADARRIVSAAAATEGIDHVIDKLRVR
jgi:osmotically-inducible protein OsmY